MNRNLLRAAAFSAFACVASHGSGAHAESRAPLATSLQGAAKEAYDSAKLLVANKDYAGAVSKFQQAYDLAKDPRLLYDVAVCEKNLHHYARMQALLQRYREEGQLNSATRETVDDALSAIRGLVGTVRVTSNEAEAAVALDGEEVGKTPLERPLAVDLGKHTVTLKKTGLVSVEKTFETSGGSEIAIELTFAPPARPALLTITADDASTVVVDGKVLGSGHFNGPIPAGVHQVRVSKTGMLSYQNSVDLGEGEERSLHVTLESERHGSILPWVIGGVVIVAGAVVGGYFLFKPQDQQGPPPTGNLGSLQFSGFRR
jgi:PEGA domain